jgi:hypothetical protein
MSDLSFLIRAPLRLDLGGGAMAVVERWSLDGIEPPQGLGGSEGEARLILPFHGFEITFDVTLRRDPERNIMRFVDLDDRQERVLRHFYREIVSGRAESVDGLIVAMDMPVDRVPMTPTKAEVKASPKRLRRPVRAAAVIGLYGMLGVLLYGPIITPVVERFSAGAEAVADSPSGPEVEAIELTGGQIAMDRMALTDLSAPRTAPPYPSSP